MRDQQTILVLLSTLRAEGTPVLASDLIRLWQAQGARIVVATFFNDSDEMRQEFEAMRIPLHCLQINPRGSAKFFQIALRVNRLCRKVGAKSVLCFPFGWHGYLSWGAKLAGVRNIVAHAGNYPPSYSVLSCWKMALAAWLGIPFGAQVACCSDYVREGLALRLGIPFRYLHTIYNGIDLSRFSLPSLPFAQSAGRRFRFGMVARLEGHKDQPTLLRALRILLDRGLDLQLELVGDGSRKEEFARLIDALGLQNNVCLLGTRRDIPDVLRNWDAFIFSVTPNEGLGIALIEALASGVPVIASDVGACREVLCLPGQDPLGRLIPPGSPEALADAIESLMISQNQSNKQAIRARESVLSRFSIENMAARYLSLLTSP